MSIGRIGARIHDLVKKNETHLIDVLRNSQVQTVQLAIPKFIGIGEPAEGFSQAQLHEIKEIFDKSEINIRVLSCYINPLASDIESEQEKFRRYVDYAVRMGVSIVGTETGTIVSNLKEFAKNHTTEVLSTMLKNLLPLIEYASEKGITVGIESVAYFPVYNEKRFTYLKDKCPKNSICCIFDPTNLLHSGNFENQHEVFENFINECADDIEVVHLKDFIYQNNWVKEVPLFDGVLDVEYIINLLKKYCIKADLIIEGAPSIQAFKIIKEKLKKIINKCNICIDES